MKKLILSLAFTTTFFQFALAQANEITVTFTDAELTEIKAKVCPELNGILLTNELDSVHPNDPLLSEIAYIDTVDNYDDDDDDDDEGNYQTGDTRTVQAQYSAESEVAGICP